MTGITRDDWKLRGMTGMPRDYWNDQGVLRMNGMTIENWDV